MSSLGPKKGSPDSGNGNTSRQTGMRSLEPKKRSPDSGNDNTSRQAGMRTPEPKKRSPDSGNDNTTSPPAPTYEDFLRVANALEVTLRRPEDVEFFRAIMDKCENLSKSGNKDVVQHVNTFLAFFVKVMQRNCASQPLDVYEQWYDKSGEFSQVQGAKRVHRWLETDKSYFAMMKTDDGSIIFYTAIATDPSAGWDTGGLAKLT